MARERISLYDTTLRDGAQTHGVDFSVEDKWLIAQQLDVLGIDYIEGGYPGANPTDTRLFAEAKPLGHAKLTAFGMTKRPGRSIANDPGFQALLAAKDGRRSASSPRAWDFHVDVALGISLEENLAGIKESTEAVVASGREALIDCEHFFDGYKANPDYALGLRQDRLRRGRALGRAVRHQWRHAAGGDRADRRGSGQDDPRRPSRHPCA